MSLMDFPAADAPPPQGNEFPHVLALPERQQVPEGDLATFRFPNGYGALVIRSAAHLPAPVFEFCMLDCSGHTPQPALQTPVCQGVQTGLSHEQVTRLLLHAERLPRHPALLRADAVLQAEAF
ncbi:hypothetical protein Dgeo_2303 [Deinococcus geothermalis DSM 11300]|uniref:Uncharacterized protein n=1 Tax=Deinococcus geothermalis (strain DSM 11300 / CIP 105573 / AG-3a) TaxID=319795 RepID=Q1IVY9_DEIGD|nr:MULTISPECIES: hypothetical protein [Deinococcus]ABF46595.1 hypothetical protein Dgeo_2303 [Deinococcus geothermalis DSM 11300]MBI0445113.1 hypothetical protein [Deinococcus sp. DB0503]